MSERDWEGVWDDWDRDPAKTGYVHPYIEVLPSPFEVHRGDMGTEHHAEPWYTPDTDKWAWHCGDCGRWSRGFRYKTRESAQKGAARHNAEWGPK